MRNIIALLTASLPLGSAAAAEMTSAYTKIALDQCTRTAFSEEEGWVSYACEGYGGVMVQVAEGDLRALISYGPDAANERAAGQTFPLFNTTGETIEWRLRDGKPVATILRFYIDAPDIAKGQVLVVTQLGLGQTCHIAYVDAGANEEANELARAAADRLAGTVDCATAEPEIVGARGPVLEF